MKLLIKEVKIDKFFECKNKNSAITVRACLSSSLHTHTVCDGMRISDVNKILVRRAMAAVAIVTDIF